MDETQKIRGARHRKWAIGPLVCGILALFVGWSSVANGAVVEYASVSDLVELSDVVVRGEVARTHAFMDEEQGRIVTHTTIEVAETYMGEVDERVRIEQWGGTFREETVRIPGDATFDTGEEVVVFLRRDADDPRDILFLTALAQAKYTVERDGETPFVRRDLSHFVFKKAGSDEFFRIDGQLRTLPSLESLLHSLVDAREGEEP